MVMQADHPLHTVAAGDSAAISAQFAALRSENISPADAVSILTAFNVSITENSNLLDPSTASGWLKIIDAQTANWQNISNAGTANWTAVNNSQTTVWTPVGNSQ